MRVSMRLVSAPRTARVCILFPKVGFKNIGPLARPALNKFTRRCHISLTKDLDSLKEPIQWLSCRPGASLSSLKPALRSV